MTPVNARKLLGAQILAAVCTGLFTLFTIALLVMVIAVPVARPERIGFAIITGTAASLQALVYYGIHRARTCKQARALATVR